MRLIHTALFAILALSAVAQTKAPADTSAPHLKPHRITLADGRSYTLNIPEGFDISVAAQGLRRVRFMAKAPDGRIFVTDMYNRADNKRGAVYILDQFDPASAKFGKVTPYLTGLRNPNSVAFYTEPDGKTHWFFLALTDKLVRYRFTPGETAPTSKPETLATFPDYGLDYKYGGWHLTRTIAIGKYTDGRPRLFISVGSSCNSCEEKEAVRASILSMDIDGKNQRPYATGIRNAVGLQWVEPFGLVATDMGSDHLGDDRPEDTMYYAKEGANYGWPYCYEYKGKIFDDPSYAVIKKKISCTEVPLALTGFAAHSSPLGLAYFDSSQQSRSLRGSFLVALHGSSKKSLNRGYRVVRVRQALPPQDFITGFLEGRTVHGRPADIFPTGKDSFLVTDDYAGVIYYVYGR